jgi:hypothetical protein
LLHRDYISISGCKFSKRARRKSGFCPTLIHNKLQKDSAAPKFVKHTHTNARTCNGQKNNTQKSVMLTAGRRERKVALCMLLEQSRGCILNYKALTAAQTVSGLCALVSAGHIFEHINTYSRGYKNASTALASSTCTFCYS